MSETPGVPPITGKVFLYERPELLNKEQHGDLGFKPVKRRYGFCSKVRAIPLTMSEIPAAIKDYPIIFASNENLTPLAVVGLIDEFNLFVGEGGNWEENRYVPGYVRRYPFGVANETGGDRHAIVIDRAYEGFAKNGKPGLYAQGEPTEAVKQAIEFCRAFERDRQVTDEFAKRLKEFDLIRGQTAQFTPAGETEPRKFAEYYGVDENRLRELGEDKILDLYRLGLLPILYAVIMSMSNWRALMQRRAKRFNLTEKDILDRAQT